MRREWGGLRGSLSWLGLSLARGGRTRGRGREKSREHQLGSGEAGDVLGVPFLYL